MEITQNLNNAFHDRYDAIFQERNKNDGSAVIYDKQKLELDKSKMEIHWYEDHVHVIVCCPFSFISKPTKQFWIINTHVNFGSRATDLLYLKNILDKNTSKLILMGDFNATTNEKWYNEYINSNYMNIYEVCQEQREKTTPTKKETKYPIATYNCGKEHKAIDYQFAKNIPREDLIHSFIGNNPALPIPIDHVHQFLPNAEIPSDHIPMTCQINF